MAPARSLTVLAVAALLAGVAYAADTNNNRVDQLDRFLPNLKFLSRSQRAELANMPLGKVFESVQQAKRGRMLAESSACQQLQKQQQCGVHNTSETCNAASGCEFSSTECDVKSSDSGELDQSAGEMIVLMLLLGEPMNTCPTKTTSADCVATPNCAWTDTRTPKCGTSQTALNGALASVTDPLMKGMYADSMTCSTVIGDDKVKCDAAKNCEYKSVSSTSSTPSGRKLLGSEDSESGNTCEATPLASMLLVKANCGTATFESMKKLALADPELSATDKKALEEAETATWSAPTGSDLATGAGVASTVASAVFVAAAVFLLSM